MSDDHALRMLGRQRTLRVTAAGALHADNAHRLLKAVIGLLARYEPVAMRLDLGALGRIDAAGVTAIVLCQREASRRGVSFTIGACSASAAAALLAHRAGHLLPVRHVMPLRRLLTGTVCRRRGARPPYVADPETGGPR